MSTQLETMILEERALAQELEFLNNAEDIASAAEKVFQYIDTKTDVFTSPPALENEWWARDKPKDSACCEIQ